MVNDRYLVRDAIDTWYGKFVTHIQYCQTDVEETKFTALEVMRAEAIRGPMMVEEGTFKEDEGLPWYAWLASEKLELPVTASGLAIMCLGANHPREVLMNVVFARKHFEKVRTSSGPLADATFMMMFFGQGTLSSQFYEYMWNAQKVKCLDGTSVNMLENLIAEDFIKN